MRLSPFDDSNDDKWLHSAPLYGKRVTYTHPSDPHTFKLFPARNGADEDLDGYQRIPRDAKEYEQKSINFDIPNANSGEEYFQIIITGDRPQIQWYSRSEFETRFLYDPLDPPCPRGADPKIWKRNAKKRARKQTESYINLNRDCGELLQRIARLWNGEEVCGVHLLADNVPSIEQLTDDLDEEKLKDLYYNTNLGHNVILAFGDADWFKTTERFLKPKYLFRKQVWYDITQKFRDLMNNGGYKPSLKGDPYEGLVHRVTVGLVNLHDAHRGWDSRSYHHKEDYVIDVLGKDDNEQVYAREILTEHHNWELYRKTYRKMEYLDQKGVKPIAVFDSRETAYAVFNHWHRKGPAELPNGPFNSNYSIDAGRKQIKQAYQSDCYHWVVADWTTTWKLKQKTLGPEGPELDRDLIVSLDW